MCGTFGVCIEYVAYVECVECRVGVGAGMMWCGFGVRSGLEWIKGCRRKRIYFSSVYGRGEEGGGGRGGREEEEGKRRRRR